MVDHEGRRIHFVKVPHWIKLGLRTQRLRTWGCLLAGLCWMLWASDATACPTCKEALATSGNSMNLVRGYGWSIIFMLSIPFLTVAALGSYFYLLVRQAQAGKGPLAVTESVPLDVPMTR
jgi:hypothetical protein